ncbi:hypothetical protein E2C01_021692 [Portunus trituberculatus]|uniref:Uncharacterized protein n=1 Tax=Portunus trituberculatus TaxID=210409 RepID=A0A5B7E5L2_PORTR|nr:hypothetical protein [Portunus trituberculatus]
MVYFTPHHPVFVSLEAPYHSFPGTWRAGMPPRPRRQDML